MSFHSIYQITLQPRFSTILWKMHIFSDFFCFLRQQLWCSTQLFDFGRQLWCTQIFELGLRFTLCIILFIIHFGMLCTCTHELTSCGTRFIRNLNYLLVIRGGIKTHHNEIILNFHQCLQQITSQLYIYSKLVIQNI